MTTQEKVSVIIPCYNREASVRESVESVLLQDYPELEVIAVDDNSSDATLEVLRDIHDPRLKVVTNTGQRGASSARNFGLALARGKWIAFNDSDDLWQAGKLSAQMALLAADQDCIATYCTMDAIDGTEFRGVTMGATPGAHVMHLSGDLLEPLLEGNFIAVQTLVVRADLLTEIGGFDTAMPALGDWDLVLRIAAKGQISYLPEVLALRRPSDNSISHGTDNWRSAVTYVLEKHAAHYQAHPAIRAGLEHRMAWRARQDGDLAGALRHQKRAAQLQPLSIRYRALALLAGLRLIRAMSR